MLVVGKTVAFGLNNDLDSGWKGKKNSVWGPVTCWLVSQRLNPVPPRPDETLSLCVCKFGNLWLCF